jgi:hypothetical protein
MSARRSVLAALAIAATFSVPGLAAESRIWPPPGVSFHGVTRAPDISGLWLGTATGVPGVPFAPNRGPADGRPGTFWAPWPLPYTPTFQKILDERAEAAKAGRALGDLSAQCLPFGLPRMLVSKFYPDEIVQTPGHVTIFVNSTFPIMIWTDGRPHPKDVVPSFNGHSIGYWVGDTLFVETVGLNGKAALDSGRNPLSDQARLKWSMRRVADDTIHVHLTVHDEVAFTEPVVTTNIWRRMSDSRWQILDDASCFENNRNVIDDSGAVGFKTF